MPTLSLSYAIVTPAHNEAAFIELTIRSMLEQTYLPLRWVIVSDGSTDGTDEVVSRYTAAHPWIELVCLPSRNTRDFGGKVRAFNAGLERLKGIAYDCIGNIDADLSLSPTHFEFLLSRFEEDPKLGLAGVPFSEDGRTYNYKFSSTEHVSGACQLFRRKCFESIGGYVPLKHGGIDDLAVLTARMQGWRTKTFTEHTCIHHRPMGSASYSSPLRANFRLGERAYALGFHPAWQILRSLYQMLRKPYVIGGAGLAAGYLWAACRRAERPISDACIEFQRRDQMRRLRTILKPTASH